MGDALLGVGGPGGDLHGPDHGRGAGQPVQSAADGVALAELDVVAQGDEAPVEAGVEPAQGMQEGREIAGEASGGVPGVDALDGRELGGRDDARGRRCGRGKGGGKGRGWAGVVGRGGRGGREELGDVGDEVVEVEGLGEEGGGSGGEGGLALVGADARAAGDDGHVLAAGDAPDAADGLPSVHDGHFEVDHEGVEAGGVGLDGVEGGEAVGHEQGAGILLPKGGLEDAEVGGVVVGDEDATACEAMGAWALGRGDGGTGVGLAVGLAVGWVEAGEFLGEEG